jgi:antitoxin HicB
MAESWSHPIELRHEAGEVHAYCAGLPEAIAAGVTPEDALREMSEAVIAAIHGRIKDGMARPAPSTAGRHRVALPATLAAKAAIYAAWKAAAISKTSLARSMGRNQAEVRRILDPDHGTKLDQLEEAAKALGGRLTIVVEAA